MASSNLSSDKFSPDDSEIVEKAVRETVEMLMAKTVANLSTKKPSSSSDSGGGDFEQQQSNGISEIGRLIIAECSSAECSKSNSPMAAEPNEREIKETSTIPLDGFPLAAAVPPNPSGQTPTLANKTAQKMSSIPKSEAPNAPTPPQMAQSAPSMATTITLKKMPIQPTPVAKILPKPSAASKIAPQQKPIQSMGQPQMEVVAKQMQAIMDQKAAMVPKMTTKLIRVCAGTVGANGGETTTTTMTTTAMGLGPRMAMPTTTTTILNQIPSQKSGQMGQIQGQIMGQTVGQILGQTNVQQNVGQMANMANNANRPNQLVPIRPKIRLNAKGSNNGAKSNSRPSSTSSAPSSNSAIPQPSAPSKIDQQSTEDHLAATVDKVAAGVEISPKQEEKTLPAQMAPSNVTTTPAPGNAKSGGSTASKSRKKKPAASIPPTNVNNGGIGGGNSSAQMPPTSTTAGATGANSSATNFLVQAAAKDGTGFCGQMGGGMGGMGGMGGAPAFPFVGGQTTQQIVTSTTTPSNGIFAAAAAQNPQFALAPNGNLVAVSAGGMTHFLIRQQPNPASVSGHFIPFMPPGGQFFLSPVHQIAEHPKQQNSGGNNNGGLGGQQGTMVHQGQHGPSTSIGSFPPNHLHLHPSNPSNPHLAKSPKKHSHHPQIVPPPEMMAASANSSSAAAVDEEENEPPPVLDKPQPAEEPDEPAMMAPNGGGGCSARLLESIFQKEAKIIRDRFTGAGRKGGGGPIVHEIDGFRIEEDIEPFPLENKKLLDALKEGKSLTNSPEEETKNADKKRKATGTKSSQGGTPPQAKKARGSSKNQASTSAKSLAEKGGHPPGQLKGRKRELKGLLEMDFGPGKTPFLTSDPDEYTEEVLIEAKKHARLMSEERPNSSTSKLKRGEKERSSQSSSFTAANPQQTIKQEKRTPNGKESGGGNGNGKEKAGGSGERRGHHGGRSSSREYETEEEGHCHNCGKSFQEVGRCQGHEQYCSRECHKAMKKRLKKLKKTASREEGAMNGGLAVNGGNQQEERSPSTMTHQRRSGSDQSASASTPTGPAQPQQKWTSPLGSAFAAVQPQMAAVQSGAAVGMVSPTNGNGDPQGSSGGTHQHQQAAIFFAPGTSQQQIHQHQIHAAHHPQMVQMPHPQLIPSPHQFVAAGHHPLPSPYFHPQQFAAVHHAAAAQQQMMQSGSSAAAFFGQFPATMLQPQASGTSATAAFHHRSPPQPQQQQLVGQSPPLTPAGTPATPSSLGGKNAGEIDALLARGIHNWTPEEVAKWVNFVTNSASNGEAFVQQEIDGSSLLLLNCDQLQNELKLKLGPAVKLQNALNSHKAKYHLI